MTPEQLILLAKARRRRAEAQPPPNDVPPGGDMSAWQQTPPGLKPTPPTLGEDLMGGAAAAAKGAIKGVTALPGMVADVPFQVANMLGAEQQLPSRAQSAMLEQVLGDTSNYRTVENFANAGTGALMPAAMAARAAQGASGLTAAALRSFAAAPGTQMLSGVTGEGARQAAEAGGAGALGQTAAALAGGVSGAMGTQLAGDALGKVGKVLYHAGVEPHSAAGREAIKGRAYLDAAGDRAHPIAQALRDYEPVVPGSIAPAGEAAAGAGSAEFSAMQRSADGVLPSEYVARGKTRDAARLDAVRSVGQSPEALAEAKALRARNAEANYGAVENDLVDADLGALEGTPAMQDALHAARTSAAQRRGYFPEEGEPYNVRNLQRTKKALDDSISASQNSAAAGRVPTLSPGELTDAKRELVGKLETASPGWKAARDQFAEESVPINQMEVGRFLESKLTNALDDEAPQRAAGYANALRDAPRTIKSAVTGSPRFKELVDVLKPEQVRVVESVRDDLASMAEQQRLATAGSRSGKNVMQAFTNSIDATGHSGQLPNLLSRPAMAFNFIMRRLKGQMDEKLAREIAKEMLDPQATGLAIERAIGRQEAPKTAAALRYRQKAEAGARGAMSAATGTIGE